MVVARLGVVVGGDEASEGAAAVAEARVFALAVVGADEALGRELVEGAEERAQRARALLGRHQLLVCQPQRPTERRRVRLGLDPTS